MSHSSRRTSKFSPGKIALLDLLLEEEGLDSTPALTIPRRSDTAPCPLSFAQERLWFLDQLQPNSPLYNMPAALRLSGPFDVAALQRSLMAVVRRHESLRTTVATVAGQPVQVIAPSQAVPFPLIDLQGLTPQAQDAAAQRLATEAAQCPFDLAHGPVFRASVLRLGAQEHVLLLNLHHIIADEWSMGVLVREVTAFYTAYALGRPARLPELPIQYADYAVWQRGWLQETVLEAQLNYWRTQLADLPTLELPTDHPRPSVPSFQGARHDFVLSPTLSADLGTLSRREGVTLFMTLLAAWQVLLARYSQQDDIVVGTPIANRTYKETEDLIGCFVNTLVLRTKMEDHPTFQAVLQRVQEVALGAYAHQDLPFEQLVEALQPARALSHHPLFQVAFALQNAPTASLDPSSLTLRPLPVAHSTAKFDLSLAFTEAGPELAGRLEYRTDLFEASTIARMTGHIETLLAGIVADPAQRLVDLPLLTDAERRQLLVDWNATARDYPQGACLHHLFEAQVARSPDAIAVVFDRPTTNDQRPTTTNHRGDKETRRHRDTGIRPSAETQPPTPNTQHPTPNTQHLTYDELNRRADQLAHHLQSLGVGPEVRVGLCLERSPEVVVGLLGILKAGGAYVPLVPSYPAERLAFMLEDAQVSVLLTRQQFISRLSPHDAQVVRLDTDWPVVAQLCAETPPSAVQPEHLAYLIYTSGTTGRPKAVMVEHHSIVNTLCASQSVYQFTSHDRVPCLLSFSFDIALFECLSPLLVGGVSILVPEEHVLDFPQWSRLLSEITFLHGPPSLLRQIVSFAQAAEEYSRYDQLRQVAVGGDIIPLELIQDMQHVFATAQVYMGYGPTEGTIMCTNYPVLRDAPPHKHVIGRPMQNMQVRLYDPNQRLVPIGVPGELYIGGVGVTRGYLHQEALTNDKYVVIDGQRWYRTGDRACYLPDGNLVFLGRIDEQIKVRGFRIEPGEIETVLIDHPEVQESVVVAQADEGGEKRLVVYIVPRWVREIGADKRSAVKPPDQQPAIELWPSISDYHVLDELLFYAMLQDERRLSMYQIAIERSVKDKVVLEIGPGEDGILSQFCVAAGARKVYAVEILERVYRAVKAKVEQLGLEDQITVIHGDSTTIQLPEKVDVCILSLFGSIGSGQGGIPIINDARRFLKGGGVIIPERSVTKIVAVCLPDTFLTTPEFTEISSNYVKKIFDQFGHPFDLRLAIKSFPRDNIISNIEIFEDLDCTALIEPLYQREIELTIHRTTRLDGFLLWLNLYTLPDLVTDIFEHQQSLLPVYLPVFYPGIAVSEGDVLKVRCGNWLSTDERHPDYHIGGVVIKRNGPSITFDYTSAHHSAGYKATPFYELLFRDDHIPVRRAQRSHNLIEELRHYLSTRLPEYMVPSVFVLLDALPLTPNRKVDRRALPAPDSSRSLDTSLFVAPSTPIEELLAQIWADVLHPDRVGAHDNFFALGGHSLLATQVVARVRTALALELPLRELFEAPTIAALAERIAAAQRATVGLSTAPLLPTARTQPPSLSFAQQRLWFLDQLQPDSPLYTLPTALHVSGPLDVAALRQGLAAVVRRHEALRTTIGLVAGQPVQLIAPPQAVPLPLLDLRSLPAALRDVIALGLATAEARRPFDLARGPVLRVTMLRLTADEHVLLLTMHHIAADGWSMSLLVRDLTALYAAYAHGQPASLPALPIQYADYAVWQRTWLQGAVLDAELAYWKGQLAGLPTLQLPTDHARPAVPSLGGVSHAFALPAQVSMDLAVLSRREGVTLFMTLLAAFQVLLARYSDQDDIVVGTPIANRTHKETENLIGFFVNTLVLRSDLAGNPSFCELLGRVRAICLDAYAHQDLPFEKLVEELQPARDLSRQPLFQVMFALQNTPQEAVTLPALTFRPLEVEPATAKFDLSLAFVETEAGLAGVVEYSIDLFAAPTIARMVGHLTTLLTGVVADPTRRLAALPLLSDAERAQLLVVWNATGADYELDSCFHQLFERQVARTPDAVAVVFDGPTTTVRGQGSGVRGQGTRDWGLGTGDWGLGDSQSPIPNPQSPTLTPNTQHPTPNTQHLTYRELNQRANRLAHYLRSLGAGPERLIAICIQRSLEMLIGVLGVLKAGSAYVPFDPTYPAERLAFMLEDTQPVVLLTQAHLLNQLPAAAMLAVCIDTDAVRIAQMSEANPATPMTVENLAYVIYTSGSTGRPKGVQVPHRGLCNLARMMRQTFGLVPESHVLQLASFSFDASFWDLLLAFPAGATLCIAAEEARLPGPDLPQLLDRHVITNASLTPSMLASLPVGSYPTLQTLITTGEACTPDIVARWAPGRQFLNGYGPTEVTVGATIGECSDGSRRPTIGRPFPNTQVYLLDRYQQLVPIGVPGEVYIGGVGVARGYLNRPDLTAERFVPNPFGGVTGVGCWVMGAESTTTHHPPPNTRLYRTGDLACYRADGMLDFLGRVDRQVKIRGFRVELGEIEALLGQHPAVRESVVLARGDMPGEQRLVAYLVTSDKLQVTSSDEQTDSSLVTRHSLLVTQLRAFLQERLPGYMVPSAFVLLDALPLTTHGKVDWRALPAPDPRHVARDTPFVAPRTPIETLLASIWMDVLRREQIGVHDNFFALGGHSLLATQLISRVREVFAVELPLRTLFGTPTIAGLTERIMIARHDIQSPLAPPLRPVPRDRPLPLSFAQQRLWVLEQIEANSPAYNLPNAIRMAGPIDIGALRQSLNMVVRRHEALRTTFAVVDGQPVQVIGRPRAVSLPLLDLHALPEDERERAAQLLARRDAHRPFDLARGPLLRTTLLRLTSQDHVILLNMHHIVADGWSMVVLIREVTALYIAHVAGQPAYLPELPIQYVDYAAWQREWLQGPVLDAQLAYWRNQLADLPVLQLPTDHPRPPAPSFQGASYPFLPPPTLHADLLAFSQAEGVTLFMTLLAAFQVLLARYSGQDDIAVGTDVANRTRAEIEPLIGFFINQLVLRGDLHGNPTFRTLLQQVRARALDAYTHQDLPFEHLVKELNPVRSLAYSPLFQVKITMQHIPPATETTADLSFQPLGDDSSFARFDLVLTLMEDTDRLMGTLEYRTDLFDAATIVRMAGHYQMLLEGIVSGPTRRLADLPILSATEQRQLLVDWNATATATPTEDCIHQLFAAQAARSPDAIALVFDRRQGDKETEDRRSKIEDRGSTSFHPPSPIPHPPSLILSPEQLTYDELNTRANQLAHYLQRLGVRLEVRVGLCAERSLDMLIGLLGILKAGGAYVPLDPDYPSARLAYMIEDSQTSLLLTQTRLIDRLPTSWLLVVCLDDWTAIADECAEAPNCGAYADNLAYMIYTSGSTGMPKGVLVAHGGLCNLAAAQITAFGVQPASRVLQFASLSFDAAVSEMFMALAAGATLCLAPPAALLPGPDLHQFLRTQLITIATLPPSALAILPTTPLPALQTLIAAGEACPADLATRWASGRCFLNAYGPTEVTVCATIGESDDSAHPPPIGRPIANTQVYLLDVYMQPVPVGVPGELYIGGLGVARSYFNRADLTAERFVPNPFAGVLGVGCWVLEESAPNTQHPTPNTRLYQTGDLARFRQDGQIEFLGRRDQQVKVRGYRIELGEIEALLQRHPDVREAVALAREDTPGDVRLVAYLVTSNELPVTSSPDSSLVTRHSSLVPELRAFLKEHLPEYMVPSAFVMLEALPLTTSGKVDRKALPVPGSPQSGQEETFVMPRTPDEELLAGIWAEVLQLDHVGADDNFFTLGGHSLLGAQVAARVYDAFGVELPLRRLFETPTVADLAAQIASARQSAPALQAPPLRPAARDGALPLSFAQQRLWFLDQLQPFSPAYNIPTAVRLTTPLDIAALAQSLSAIMGRHEALRTTFALVEGQPVQVIAPPAPVPLQIVDLHDLPEAERAAMVLRLTAEESRQPFDLMHGPLLRARLMRVGAEDHVVLLTMHHIVSDGWSAGVFIRELTALYVAHTTGRTAQLPELPIQYADYAIWQRSWLHGAVLEAHLAYWRTQLADLSALDLPTDRPRPAVPTFVGARGSFTLPRPLSEALVALSRRQGVTLFMTLLAAFQLLLAHYSGQDDIAVGTPVANRSRAETEYLIGCFINTLVLRVDLAGNPTFYELLRRVREMALESYAHQELPFEQVVEAIQPERDLSRHPLFQVLFMLQNAPVTPLELPSMALRPLAIERDTAQFDLTLSVEQTPAGQVGSLEYRTDLFEAPTIARMLEHFRVLLEGIVADPGRHIAALPLLTDDERRQLLVDWNATATNYPHERCIHQLFAAQAARTPDVVAVVFEGRPTTVRSQGSGVRSQGDTETEDRRSKIEDRGSTILHPPSSILHPQSLTYTELNERANRLAHHLRGLGVGPEVHVGLCLERSLELIVGLLGILKAGGAYVPLDLAYPAERLAFMLADAQVPVVLTQKSIYDLRLTIDDLEESASPIVNRKSKIVNLDADWPAIAQAPPLAPISGTTAENLVYMIYTSGSTGTPKGVMAHHGGLVNFTLAIAEQIGLCPTQRFLQFASFSFDASTLQVFPTLISGATLILHPDPTRLSNHELLEVCVRQAVSVLDLPAAFWQQWIVDLAARRMRLPATVQVCMTGGESIALDRLRTWAELAERPVRFFSSYGPTEATVTTTLFGTASDQVAQIAQPLVPLGRRLANTQLYLLDRHMQPVPVGVVGEIYLGGAGLVRGYLDRPDLTAERFVPNPFTGVLGVGYWVLEDSTPNTQHPTPNTRLYKTGDLARYRSDGNLDFIGRVDQQVKIRGFRVELGEIEALLGQHPAVRESVVLAREDLPGDKRLVAYLVTSHKSQVTSSVDSSLVTRHSSLVAELRGFLKERLPDYMVPSAFVALAALPLTANGKVNTQALPTPDRDNAEARPAYQAPRDSVELALTRIWEEILSIRPIGVTDSFFELGGHSLLAVSLMARVRQQLGYDLPLATLFQGPTIEQLAALLHQHTDALSYSPIVEIQPGRSKPPFFCVHPSGGTVLCYADLARQLGPDQPFYGLQARGLYGEQEPFSCIEDMAAEYIAALRAVQPHGPYFLGGWSMGGIVAFEMAQQLHHQGQEVALLALLDLLAPVSGNQTTPPDDTRLLAELLGKENLPIPYKAFQQLAPDEQVHRALDAARQANILPMSIGVADVQRFLRVWNANILAISSYVPQVYPSRITLFKTELPTEDAGAPEIADPTLGWSALSTQPVVVYTVPGTHQTMVSEPHVQILAEQLQNWLNASPSDGHC